MKENLKEFFQTKKDLFVFIGLLLLTFVTVITIAQITLKDDDMVTVAPNPDEDNNDDTTTNPEEDVIEYISNPYKGTKVVVRTFYNDEIDNNDDSLIVSGNTVVNSKGVSYASEDNKSFEVFAIYSGTVTKVVEDDVVGTCITIDHGNDLVSVYSSLENTTVSVGEEVTNETIIGWAAATSFDLNAGVHVHVEIFSKADRQYLDLRNYVGKTMDDVVSSIK